MRPGVRKLALTAHVMSSVGWTGAVAAYLALAVAALASRDAQLVRGAYLAMEVTAWAVIVPLSLGSLLTGVVQALGTTWGLFRHYWILFKLVLNLLASSLLLLYTQTIGYFADVAAAATSSGAELGELKNPTHVLHAGGALLLLLVATVLAVYKPRGLTPYGRRRRHHQRAALVP